MPGELIALRILHIGGGVFWVGTTLFAAFFLEPSVSAAGPAGGEVMKRLNATRFHPVMITLTLLTLLAGLRLLWILSGGFNATWVRSSSGLCYMIGGVSALVGFVIGAAVNGPTARKLGTVTDATAREALLARLRVATRATAWLLILTVVLMAIGRYV
jgi:uncharacterized membrane protein